MIFAKDKMSKLFTNFSTDETFDYKDRDNAAMKGYITFNITTPRSRSLPPPNLLESSTVTFYSEEDYGGTYKTLPFVTNIKYSLNSSTCGPDEYKITFLPNSIKLKNVNDTILIRLHGDYSKTEDYCSSSHRMIFAKDKMSKLFTNFSTDETFDYKDRDNAAMKGYITFIQ